jgi:DNA primase
MNCRSPLKKENAFGYVGKVCDPRGDVFSFMMKSDGISFKEALGQLAESALAKGANRMEKPIGTIEAENANTGELTKSELEYLKKAAAYYHKSLLKNEKAIVYLQSRGISAEAIRTFKLGFVDGTLKDKLNPDGKKNLESVGLLNERGHETIFGSVVFPLLDANSNQPVGLYACHVEKKQHLYLSGKRRGVFNPAGTKETEEIFLTESVIDALALWSIGIRNVTCAYGVNGLTDEIINHLAESRIKKVTLILDTDESGREAVGKFSEKLSAIGIESSTCFPPVKEAAKFIADGGTLETVQSLLSAAETKTEAVSAELETLTDGTRRITFENREYRVRGLSPVGLEKLKINLRMTVGKLFHLDTLDLYQFRLRQTFTQVAAKLCGVNESTINADILSLIEHLEAERLQMRKTSAAEVETAAPMTKAEKQVALAFLKDANLCEKIVEDFRRCGLVGERSTVLTAYLGAVSRKLSEPLALLIVARSGAGKSALQDALCAFVPPEELVRVTRLTGQALFYKDPYSLQRKMLVIAEDEGAKEAVYSLRTLASDQRLSIAVTRTDPNTGKLATGHYEVFGPVVILITTTSAEAFDEETRSRFVQLSMNESIAQTKAILERQRHQHSLLGVLEKAESEEIKKLHHHAQRLLKPLAVVNPFVEYLTYSSEKIIHRREQRKYLSLINSIALLHQYQREVKTARRGDIEIEYVEVTLEDIALANELAKEILAKAMDELAPPVRGMFEAIRAACRESRQNQLTRREIRELTGWSDWQVRMYCQKLLKMEYLFAVQAQNGKPAVYGIARDEDAETPSLRGLTSIEELKKRLAKAAQEKAAGGSLS